MDNQFLPKLCGVEFENNKIEKGDPLVVTTRWKNTSDKNADFIGQVVIDIDIFNYQRIEPHIQRNYNIKWSPYPAMFQWKKDQMIETAAVWRNSAGTQWVGAFKVTVSLLDDNGTRVPFIGKDGEIVDHEFVSIIDIGWGLGRKRLWETNRYSNIVYDDTFIAADAQKDDSVKMNDYWSFDKKLPVPTGYGSWKFAPSQIEVVARNVEENKLYRLHTEEEITSKLVSSSDTEICYNLSIFCGSFDMVYELKGEELYLEPKNVIIKDGYEIIKIYIPNFVVANEKSKMVHAAFGGRMLDIAGALPTGLRIIFDADQIGSLFDDEQQIVVDTVDLNTVIHQSVHVVNKEKIGVIGIELFIMRPADKKGLGSIKLPRCSNCRVQKTAPGWNETVKLLREKYHGNNCHLYDRSIIYKFLTDWGPKIPEDAAKLTRPMTIEDMTKLVKDVHKALDGIHQIAYVGGWQYEGHDTGYPNVDKNPINPRMGGTEEDFVNFIANGKNYNATISLHDNFEDIYLEPGVDPDQTGAMDRFGELFKAWIWCGGQAYTQSPKKFVESGRARERITNIVKRFGIKDTYHLDGLTSEILRENFEPGNQSDFNENNEYKKEIVKIWNEFGIDISSESLTSPLVGTIGHAWSTRDNFGTRTYFPNEIAIPLVAMACHGIIPYNMYAGGDSFDKRFVLWGLAYGGNIGWGDTFALDKNLINGFYLQGLPMGLIEYEKMEKYDLTEDYANAYYTNDCHVFCDNKNQKYEVVKNGIVIAKDYTTFAEGFKEGTYLAYAAEDCTVVYDAPAGWESAFVIEFLNDDKEVPLTIKDGKITLTLTSCQPMRVVKK